MNIKFLRIYFFLSLLLLSFHATSQRVMSLQQALEQAFTSSPRMKEVRLSLEQSEQNLKASRAALKSNFSLNFTPIEYSKTREFNSQLSQWYTVEDYTSLGNLNITQPILLTDGSISLNNTFSYVENSSTSNTGTSGFDGFTNSLSLQLDQPLFTYNRTKQELKSLELAYENSSLNYALQMLTVENNVTQAFYQVYQSQMEYHVAKEEYENRVKSHEIIKNKVEGGLVAREELYQSELDLLSSKSTMQNAEVSFENNKDNFKQMLGIPLDEMIMVLADISITPIDIDLKKAIDNGLKSRMEIRQREIEIEEGQFDLIQTNAENEFKGELSVSLGLFGQNENVSNVFQDQTNSQGISFGLTVPLWDWGEKKAKLKATKASLEMSQNNYDDEIIDIKLNIRQVYRSLNNQLIQVEISRKTVENAQLTYEINLEKYRNGDLTSMDLNLVQNQLTQSKNDLTNAIIDYKLELLNMKIQSMYDFEKDESVSPKLSPNKK